MKIVSRSGKDDFWAYQVANVMMANGADVFSITVHPVHHSWHVWAKVSDVYNMDALDDQINRTLYPDDYDEDGNEIGDGF